MINKRKGFTLLELLVSTAIICILVALLLPPATRLKDSATRMACLNHQRQLMIIAQSYALDEAGWWPPTTTESVSSIDGVSPSGINRLDLNLWTRQFFVRSGTIPNYAGPTNLGIAWEGGYFWEGELMYCPGQSYRAFVYETYGPRFPTCRVIGEYYLNSLVVRASQSWNPITEQCAGQWLGDPSDRYGGSRKGGRGGGRNASSTAGIGGTKTNQQSGRLWSVDRRRRYETVDSITQPADTLMLMDLIELPIAIGHPTDSVWNINMADGSGHSVKSEEVRNLLDLKPSVSHWDHEAYDQAIKYLTEGK